MSDREPGIPASSELGPERPGAEGAESGRVEVSDREPGIPASSEPVRRSGVERPGAVGAESGRA